MTSTSLPLAAAQAKQILGFYDTIPAMDQQAFTAGFVEMLSIYPQAVLERATSPSRGLAAYVSYPNLAKFKDLLDQWHGEHIDDLRRRGLLRQNRGGSLRLCPPPDSGRPHVHGDLANVFVPTDHKRYPELVAWSKTATSEIDIRRWRFGESSDGRPGIWIAHDIWDDRRVITGDSISNLAKRAAKSAEAAE